MTLGATFADAIGGWAQGCLVLLIFVWLFLALLGIRNGRFPKRLVGGVAFVLGSALWIGLHPSLAEAWNLDAGWLGWRAQLRIAGPLAGSAFALNAIGAILLLSSLVGFLIAIDWLPLLPLAPMLARLDARMGAGFGAGGDDAASPSKTGARPLTWLRSAAAATLEREPKARLVSPAPKASVPAVTTPIPVVTAAPAAPPTTAIADEPAIAKPADDSPLASDASEPARTDWNRFRPRAKPLIEERSEDDLTVDIASDGSHNSSAPAGESRASTGIAEPSGTTPEGKDPPVLDPDQTEEHPLELSALATRGSDSATSVADDEEVGEEQEPLERTELAAPPADAKAEAVGQAVEETAEETEVAEELGPRRKKEEEPAEEPAEEPDEGEEDDEKGDDDEEFDEEEEDEDEEFEEEEEEDEDWEEDEEEEEEEEGEEGEEDEKEEDEDWEEDDEDDEDDDEDDDKDDDKDEDEEEKDENWDDDKGAAPAGPTASSEPAILEVDSSIPESAAIAEPSEDSPELAAPESEPAEAELEAAAPEAAAPEAVTTAPAVEVLTPKAEAVAPAPAPAATELPADLFRDLAADERQLLARAVDAILGLESVSLSRIQRELGITYYAAARVFERLEKEGFIAPYSGSLARAVVVTREQWEERRRRST